MMVAAQGRFCEAIVTTNNGKVSVAKAAKANSGAKKWLCDAKSDWGPSKTCLSSYKSNSNHQSGWYGDPGPKVPPYEIG